MLKSGPCKFTTDIIAALVEIASARPLKRYEPSGALSLAPLNIHFDASRLFLFDFITTPVDLEVEDPT